MSKDNAAYYSVAVYAARATGAGIYASVLRVTPEEDLEAGKHALALHLFPPADGWEDHAVQHERIAESVMELEKHAAGEMSKAVVLRGESG